MTLPARSIAIIGMMGAGKSSVGRCLHYRTGFGLYDTDELVASKFGISISQIFDRHGEEKFREAETEALRGVPTQERIIIVTGGGIVLREENVAILRKHAVIVWLDGEEETLFARASQKQNRPLLQTKHPRKVFSEILAIRRPLYAKSAHIRIDTSVLSEEEVAVAILAKMKRINPKPKSFISAEAS